MRIGMSDKWRPMVGVAAIGLLAFSVSVYGGPRVSRVDKASDNVVPQVRSTGYEILHSNGDLPTGASRSGVPLPLGVPIQHFEMHNDGSPVLTGQVAAEGDAVIYLNDYDGGYFDPQKESDAGGFMSVQMSMGNGFVIGDLVTGYSLTVYASSAGTTPNSVRLSLWDGDPGALVDTVVNNPPQEIAGTDCMFTALNMGGEDVTGCVAGVCIGGYFDGVDMGCTAETFQGDCGGCPGMLSDGWIADPWDEATQSGCAGMHKLICTPASPVAMPTKRPWLKFEVPEGCRVGARFGSWYVAPKVASGGGAVGCLGVTGPCGDFVEENYAYGQFGGPATGTCCDTGAACDHSNEDTVDNCVHPSFCGPGVADTLTGWYYGAPTYYASFVMDATGAHPAGVTNPVIRMVPTGCSGDCTISGSSVEMEVCPQEVWFSMEVSNWDPDLDGDPKIKTWQIKLDPSGYTSGSLGYLTPWNAPCAAGDHAACVAALGTGATCATDDPASGYPPGGCTPGFMDFSTDNKLQLDLPAASISNLAYVYGSTIVFNPPATDDGLVHNGPKLVLTMSPDAQGVFTVGFDTASTYLKNNAGVAIPMLALIPAKIDCMLGQCCDLSGGPGAFVCDSDGVTKDYCENTVGGVWTHNAYCTDADDNDECGCTENIHCSDGDACTTDTCDVGTGVCSSVDVADYTGLCCDPADGSTTVVDDLDQCTADACSIGVERGVATHTNTTDACNDGNVCTYGDVCDAGLCAGIPVNSAMIACSTSDDCETATGVPHPCVGGYCFCQLAPPMGFLPPEDAPDDNCYEPGTKVEWGIHVGASAGFIVGGQFTAFWDPTCLEFESIAGVAPYTNVIMSEMQGAGQLFYAVGIDPLVGGGTYGDVDMAVMTFTKIGDCSSCQLCIGGENPYEARLSDADGQPIDVVPGCGKMILTADVVTVDVPDDVTTNVFCDRNTADVAWAAPTAASDCYEATLVCAGTDPNGGAYAEEIVMGGGELPIGVSNFTCTATSTVCDTEATADWTVTVVEQTALDIVIQVSPIMSGDVERCIEFELYSDCVADPFTFDALIPFGGKYDHVGHYTDALKIPAAGQWVCITAMDQLHSLRAVDMLECGADGAYHAVFKGDPFFGGNWLIQGNLDAWKKDNPLASHDVIDITDFGQFIGNYLATVNPNTACPSHPDFGHADINGDGVVDMLDYAFVQMNFMQHSKGACCPDVTASVPTARTEISVRELRAAGMGDLSIADLNNDGLLNVDDMRAFEAGAVPVTKAPRRGAGIR